MNPEQVFLQTLASDGVCYIDDDISPSTLRVVTKTLTYAHTRKMPLTLYIKSSGGDVLTSLKIYSALQAYSFPVTGIIIGEANSASATILQGCTIRLMHRYNSIHLHAVESKRSVYQKEDVEGMRMQHIVEGILTEKTNLSKEEINKIMINPGGKRFFDKEILDAGLADKFVEKN